MAKHTHRGTCQACGRRQAVSEGRIAKHGYTTKYGFFMGVCPGARELPLEKSADVLDLTVARLVAFADELEADVAAIAAGHFPPPAEAETGRIVFERGERGLSRAKSVTVPWAEAREGDRRQTFANISCGKTVRAREARLHERNLKTLRAERLGQPLFPVERRGEKG